MKRNTIAFAIAVFFISYTNAQDIGFGFTAGYFNADAKVEVEGDNVEVDAEGGFYAGVVADFSISDKFGIRPELVYVSVNDGDALFLPVLAKIGLVDGLHIQAGPQLGFSLESDIPDDFSSVDFGFATGLGYDFPVGVFVEARYAFQINNTYTGSEDLLIKGRYLTAGVGYKF